MSCLRQVETDGRSPRWYENLMVVYYDILLLDDQSMLHARHSERFKTLEKTIQCEPGRAELVKRTLVDFQRTTAASDLRKAFAAVIRAKGEGLVLKPDGPYFNFGSGHSQTSGFCIKLKKEYIGHFGDVGDFAVVGAGFNPSKAKSYRLSNVKWTTFYLGCLKNREHVGRWAAKPEFTVVCAVEMGQQMLKTFMMHGHGAPVPSDDNEATELHVPKGIQADAPLTVAFQNPPVVDLRCFSFDKPGNVGFWTPRFPAVSKIHFDRDYTDTVTFDELQEMAKEARATPDLDDSQENLKWIAKLEGADPRGHAVDALSQLTATTMPTPSPQRPSTPLSHALPFQERAGSSESSRSGGHGSVPLCANSLATPPATSPPPVSSPESPRPGNKRKFPSQESSPRKRRPSSIAVPVSSKSKRTPLQDVDVNASPCSSSRPAAATTSTHTCKHPGKSIVSTPPKEFEENEPPRADNCHEKVSTSRKVRDCRVAVPLQPQTDGAEAPTGCQFAGEDCHLSGATVLVLSVGLASPTEHIALLRAHGLAYTILDADTWVHEHGFGASLSDTSSRVVLLVDTIHKPKETKRALSSLERLHKTSPGKTRGWIAVYDWRVLRHLKALEDVNTKDKYFDGFNDPWRRWYCGII